MRGTGPVDLVKEGDVWKLDVKVPPLQVQAIGYYVDHYKSYYTSLESFRSPLGIAFMEDGVSAWITHRHVLDRLPRVSRVDLSPPGPRVTTQERTDGAGSAQSPSERGSAAAPSAGRGNAA